MRDMPSLSGSKFMLSIVAVVVALTCPMAAHAGLNTWTSGGPEGGLVAAMIADPQTPGVLYAATIFGGIFKSATRGSMWTRLDANLSIQALALDPQNPSTIYGGLFGSTSNGGVVKSIDAGVTWQSSSSGLPALAVTALALDPTTPAILYAGVTSVGVPGRGVFRSTDGAASWLAANAGLTDLNVNALALDPRTPTTLYVGTNSGVFKSTNRAATWTPSSSGLPTVFMLALAIDPETPTTLYVGTQFGGVFKSVDAAISWSPANSGLPVSSIVTSLVIDSHNPATLYAGTLLNGIFRSTNAGVTWVPSLSDSPDVRALVIDPEVSSTVYAGSFSGVSSSSDGGSSWSRSNDGLPGATLLALTIDPGAFSILYAGGFSGLFKSTNGGASWGLKSSGLTNPFVTALAIDPLTPATLYVGTLGGGVFRSTDGAGMWVERNLGLSNLFINALAVDPRTPTTVYAGATDGEVFKSVDAAASWSPSSSGLTTTLRITVMTIDPTTSLTIYAGTAGDGVFKSTNGGASWHPSNSGLAGGGLVVNALIIDPRSPDTIYAGTNGSVFKSVDGGGHWFFSGVGLSDVASAFAFDGQNPPALYVSTGKIFKSADRGASWSQVDASGLGDHLGLALAVNPLGTCLHAATQGGVFDFATQVDPGCPSPPSLAAAVLPLTRSVQVGTHATVFATILNAAPAGTGTVGRGNESIRATATGVDGARCGITQITGAPTPFSFQTTDPLTNRVTGTPNTPADIPPGGAQTFVMSFETPTAFFGRDVQFGFNCTNADLAPTITGVNTLRLTVSATPVPDIIALAATPSNDGIVNVPGPSGIGALSVATANAGAGGTITVFADTGGATLPVRPVLCQTNPVTAQCVSGIAPTVTVAIDANDTPTFSVFVEATGSVPFDPANNRIFVRFNDADGVTRGATSVAVRTQ
jgi:photosystem II stability/assembly factor-like uncharacterized protein